MTVGSKLRELGKSVAIVLVVSGAMIGMLEIGLRVAGVTPPLPPTFTMAFSAPHPTTGFRAIPNSRWTFFSLEPDRTFRQIVGTVDEDGYRPIVHNRSCTRCSRIIVVGDSITFGAEVPDEEPWPEVFARQLGEFGIQVQARNVSFRGYSAVQAWLALDAELGTDHPVDAVIYLFSPNDVAESFTSLHGPTPVLKVEEDQRRFQIVPPDFPRYQSKMDENAFLGEFASFRYNIALFGLIARWRAKDVYNWPENIPNIDSSDAAFRKIWDQGVLNTVRRYIGLLVDAGEESDKARAAMFHVLKEMATSAQQRGAEFYVAFLPFGPFTEGATRFAFEELTGIAPEVMSEFMTAWQAFGREVERLTLESGGKYLKTDPNLFSGMTHRHYAVLPDDWHYTRAAHARFGKHIAQVFSGKARRE